MEGGSGRMNPEVAPKVKPKIKLNESNFNLRNDNVGIGK